MNKLQDFFVHQLKDIYDAEQQLLSALEKVLKETKSRRLKDEFCKDRKQTEEQLARLEKIGESLDIELSGEKCKGMKGLIKELKKVVKDDENDEVQDAALVAAYQKIKHYEIATYGTLRSYAGLLKYPESKKIFLKGLSEEKRLDKRLTTLAENRLNIDALN